MRLLIVTAAIAATLTTPGIAQEEVRIELLDPMQILGEAAAEAAQTGRDAQRVAHQNHLTCANEADAKAAYLAAVNDGEEAVVTAMHAWVTARTACNTIETAEKASVDALTKANDAMAAILQPLTNRIDELEAQVATLEDLDQEVAEQAQHIVDLELAVVNYAAIVNPLLNLLCERLKEDVYDDVCTTFQTAVILMDKSDLGSTAHWQRLNDLLAGAAVTN